MTYVTVPLWKERWSYDCWVRSVQLSIIVWYYIAIEYSFERQRWSAILEIDDIELFSRATWNDIIWIAIETAVNSVSNSDDGSGQMILIRLRNLMFLTISVQWKSNLLIFKCWPNSIFKLFSGSRSATRFSVCVQGAVIILKPTDESETY